jgi:hypothetical protein
MAALVAVTCGIAAPAAAQPSQLDSTYTSASQATPLVPGNASVAGRFYGQWAAADYKWRVSQPNITSKTSCFTAGQHGPVWFLAGGRTNAMAVTRSCAVPAGRYLMWATPSNYCSTVDRAPFHATSDAGLIRCARAAWQSEPGFETVTLDGRRLQPPAYLGGTAAFAFKMPAHNNWLRVPGRTHGRMAVYGFATILRPLSAGIHTLEVTDGFRLSGSAYSLLQVTYNLTVA